MASQRAREIFASGLAKAGRKAMAKPKPKAPVAKTPPVAPKAMGPRG